MGLDKTSIEAIFISQGWDIPKKKMLMLGRQAIHTSSDVLYFLGNKYGFSFTDNVFSIQEYVKELERYEYFSENFFKELGFDSVESLDNSDYECPTHIQNMNLPLNPELKGKFSFVFDGGTTEHIFNSVQCYQNIIDLLEVGGIFLSVTCNNNFSGHGFYQFSPEFFISCFREEYGMELLDLHIAKNNSTNEEWVRVNSLDDQPAKRNTTKIHGTDETYIITIARKISEGKRLISHPPNQYSYSYKKDITQEQTQEMTITTAFFDVGRGNWKGYNRSLEEYKEYLKEIRKICEEKGILLILDEVFLGFRLAYGGCQEYFNIKADMVLYGKTLGGRLPVGVVCNIENPFPYCNFGMPMYLLLQKYPLTHLWIFQFFHK